MKAFHGIIWRQLTVDRILSLSNLIYDGVNVITRHLSPCQFFIVCCIGLRVVPFWYCAVGPGTYRQRHYELSWASSAIEIVRLKLAGEIVIEGSCCVGYPMISSPYLSPSSDAFPMIFAFCNMCSQSFREITGRLLAVVPSDGNK